MIGTLLPDLLRGLVSTLEITVISFVGAVALGTLVAVFRVGPVAPLRWLGAAWVGVFRNLPALVLLVLWVFGLPEVGVLRFGQGLLHVILPPSFRGMVQPLGNVLIAVVLNTSLAAAVGVTELTHQSQSLSIRYAEALLTFVLAAACYVTVALLTGAAVGRVERACRFDERPRQGAVRRAGTAGAAPLAALPGERDLDHAVAVRRLLPALITEVVAVLIATTLGYAVSYTELLHNAQTVGQLYQVPVQAYLVVAAVYIVINGLLSQLATRVQRRQPAGVRPAPRAADVRVPV